MLDIDTTTKLQMNVKPQISLMKVNNLTFSYPGGFPVVIDELVISRGEHVVLTGPNGAGKTTILKLLAGLLKPHQGDIVFNGISVNQTRHAESAVSYHRRIGYVPQRLVLYNRSVYDNVAMGLRIRKLPEDEIKSNVTGMLERFRIGHLSRRNALSTSGGEARRVMLARALAIKPEILFLDEPFSDLDDEIKSEILADLLQQTHSTNSPLTVIMVTHDYSETGYPGNRLLKISRGRIIKDEAGSK